MDAPFSPPPFEKGCDILEIIAARRRIDVAAARVATPPAELEARVAARYPGAPLDLGAVLQRSGVSLATEFKRASPSKGALAPPGVCITDTVRAYASGGARVISVLTEPHWFRGSLEDLEAARAAADAWSAGTGGGERPVILRKEFVIDAYQLLEARAWGADTALLIVALLPRVEDLAPLIAAARALGMEPLVEVCSVPEMRIARAAGARAVGINNRNLRTFEVDLSTTSRVVAEAAAEEVEVPISILSLSGIKDPEDVTALMDECASVTTPLAHAAHGAPLPLGLRIMRGFLVGEALMRSSDPEDTVRRMCAAGNVALRVWGGGGTRMRCALAPLTIKVCGVTDASDAVHAAHAGASFIGIILVNGSPRGLTNEAARVVTDAVRALGSSSSSSSMIKAAIPSVESTSALSLNAARLRVVSSRFLQPVVEGQRPLTVGVFMNASPTDVAVSAAAAGVDVVQLHGSEEPAQWVGFPLPIIKALHVRTGADATPADEATPLAAAIAAWSSVASAILLDSARSSGGGCSGAAPARVAFDHARVLPALDSTLRMHMSSEGCVVGAVPVLLAGGLTPESLPPIMMLLRGAQGPLALPVPEGLPFISVVGVDVASGVEFAAGSGVARAGAKDPARVTSFCASARQ